MLTCFLRRRLLAGCEGCLQRPPASVRMPVPASSGGRSRVIAELVATTALAVWLYLLLARGAFWRCTERDDQEPVRPAVSESMRPCVVAVVPARNEADSIGKSVGSLLAQDYRGAGTVILVEDDSSDGTA